MVQLMRSENSCLKKVKCEVEESGDDELNILHKRPKLDSSHEWSCSDDPLSIPPALYNPLDEPSPLGLRLKKSPSLLDLIQMRLSQEDCTKLATANKKDQRGVKASVTTDGKLKASNFPASILKIGSWEYKSRYEGDLVAKCYFAKHKLVWEVLDGCLKNKIEIPWSDIMALKANYPDDGPGTLEVVLARRPLFFREINPQPRKHTLWQATSDFTGGQAGIQRRHFLQCPQGLLGKHFEKLIQCDPRLNYLSQQPDMVFDSPYFESKTALDDQLESTATLDRIGIGQAGLFELQDVESASAVQSSSSKSEHNLVGKALENVSQETTSPSSVMEPLRIKQLRSRETDALKFLNNLDQIKVPGLHPSMSMNDIVNHIGNCISEQITSGNPAFASNNEQSKIILDEITQYLLNDSLVTAASDEQFLMSRVDSLCCLLQKDPAATQDTSLRTNSDASGKVGEKTNLDLELSCRSTVAESGDDDASGSKQVSGGGMRRKESVGELLLNLPRIASLPQFLFPMADDSVNQVR
ncbi:hypothetical protein QN277_024771 [Acacia crassicarpa]|uniref:TRF2/HOY1 PH-like domain-containing protein n=1 Tax=Acacia crassicarpa TaxID=499986 RepID=A0AAE1JFJ0_9FABA|nr:hypothetical protein QN277_024771 [Acacia crassicarpa]